jgi:hypothetical protein
MKRSIRQTGVPVNEVGNAQAIRYRLNKAFPEMGKLFPALSRKLRAGEPPTPASTELLAALPPQRLERLSLELTDVFSMGWTDKEQFDLIMGSIFGLDIMAVQRARGSTWRFIRDLADLVAQRRHSHTTVDDRDEHRRE